MSVNLCFIGVGVRDFSKNFLKVAIRVVTESQFAVIIESCCRYC